VEKQSFGAKRKARRLALRALYQWLMADADLYEIEVQSRMANNMDKVDVDYFSMLLYGVPKHLDEIENSFKPFIDREIKDLNPIELTILRIGTFELCHCLETPYKVILDESIAMAKEYGSQDGYRYVNGVLNHVAHLKRKAEISINNE